MEIRKNLEILWESVTGVRTEDPAPFLRILSFIILALGIAWAVFSYYRSVRIADLYQDSFTEIASLSQRNDSEITQLANNVRALISMRQGGRVLAASINEMNRRLFNDEASYLAENVPDTAPGSSPLPKSSDVITMPGSSEELRVTVKAILLSQREKIAVIDLPNSKGVIIRQGGRIPAINARVLKINNDSVILSINGRKLLASFGNGESAKTDEKNNNSLLLPPASSKKRDNEAIPTRSLQEVLKSHQGLYDLIR
ncbi:MAG: hypothetical protein IJS99_03240 [Synergistaceae bacterium]|nr:hypothetical protein [Synergistaceae bacterium]